MNLELSNLHDDRGKMFLFTYGDFEFKICEMKKNTARGGDIHYHADQFDLVLKGKVQLKEMISGDEKDRILSENDVVEIKRGNPHVLIALEDSIVVEWRNGPFDREIYPVYRKYCE